MARPGFGHQWVRSHDFTIDAVIVRDSSLFMSTYAGANLTKALIWEKRNGINDKVNAYGMPWHITGLTKNTNPDEQ